MTIPSEARPRAAGDPAPSRGALSAVLLVALLAIYPALDLLPGAPGSIRIGGLSVLWWYGGVLAPIVGVAVVVGLLPRRAESPAVTPADSRPPSRRA
ncbi:MAG TPA: hypothetical protein VML54_04380 [Candidatus Limnocylindrales bacterium]|nr:hypothetical protein [Candidatus Limnocylindrales bacterium]